jgi:hypothetical protein
MAKHVILESYTFTPATKTIVVTGKYIRREQLLLITNTTTGTVIYNFSDPSLGASSLVNAVDTTTGTETTTIILAYNTAAMISTDKIAILTEETYTEIIPSEVMRDPVEKLRVSQPQSLIDTDFEYGAQPTKWESVNLINNRPSAFIDQTQGLSNTSRTDITFPGSNTSAYQITNVTASAKVVTVAIGNTTGITVGLPIFIQGTLDNANADGWWVVESVSANVNITFTTTNTPAAALYDATKTYLFIGAFFTGAAIPAGVSAISLSGSVASVTTTNAHGLRVGDGIYVVGATGMTGTLNSSWVVATTLTNNTFTFACAATGTITTVSNASIYPRSLGYVQHRAFDGGVQFTNVVPYHGYQVVRQTRRQFRYQSGKGIQFSTGTSLKPLFSVDNISSSGTTVTVTTKFAHGVLPGASIKVANCNETAYNGTFTVATVTTPLIFTYTALTTPSATPATGFPLNVGPNSWYGGSNRVGMFDSQNGFYFEYDGQTLYAVRRNSVRQVAGNMTVTSASQSVVGVNTKFSSELKPGDNIVLRGQTYVVQQITTDTQMYIYPEYRGTTAANCLGSKVGNTRFAQSTWNIDKMDGTGASGVTLDLTKMQMLYIDYTWYGAGAIRFGFKNNRGEVIYCHRIVNNNTNTEAYMRSGNLPARYETNSLPYYTNLTATLSSASTTGATISVADTTGWPSTGTVVLTQAAATSAVIEYITYTAKTATTLTIGSRAQTGGGSATTFTFSATAPIMAELYSPQFAPAVNHWGSSVIMDGRFDDDKSFVFNAGFNTALTNLISGTRIAIMSIRLAPTVDNGLTGLLGSKEVINRMQLTLRSMDIYAATTPFKIDLILNGRVSNGTYTTVGGSSLAQIAYHTSTTTISGGESIFGFFTNFNAATNQDLNQVRDIGNSILGGGTTLTCPTTVANMYPDGPDIITICATAIGGNTNTINSRVSWTEAQA